MAEEGCFAIKADPLQVRRDNNNTNIIFLKEWSKVFRNSCRIRFMRKYRRYL